MSSRTLAFSCLLLLVACGKQAEANKADPKAAKASEPPGSLPTKRLPPNDPHAAPEPGEEPEAPLVASASGTFDFTVGDRLMHLRRIPPGQNRAVVIPDGNVARVTVAGALDESGWPNVRLTLEGFRPDQASYPTTLSTKKVGRGVSLRYQISEKSFYHVDQAEGA
ncbi:MAG: hypothetical protein KDK70_41125, partial [Myxococcales bacterium]|nr:hypothetical protein [Myxococcales bacterium]